jgi:hypothetical protein
MSGMRQQEPSDVPPEVRVWEALDERVSQEDAQIASTVLLPPLEVEAALGLLQEQGKVELTERDGRTSYRRRPSIDREDKPWRKRFISGRLW